MIKHTLRGKLGNTESLKLQQFESSSTNVPIVGEDLLRLLYKLSYLQFVIQVISKKNLCSKGFTGNLRDIFT